MTRAGWGAAAVAAAAAAAVAGAGCWCCCCCFCPEAGALLLHLKYLCFVNIQGVQIDIKLAARVTHQKYCQSCVNNVFLLYNHLAIYTFIQYNY